MDTPDVKGALAPIEALVTQYNNDVSAYMETIRPSVRQQADAIVQDTTVELIKYNNYLADITNDLTYRATMNLNRSLFKYDPGELVVLMGIISTIEEIINIINIVSQVLKVITGKDLVYWIDQITPGFAEAWHDLMENISSISQALGWGVDGLLHLTNVINAGVNMWGTMTGKSYDMLQLTWYQQSIKTMQGISKATKSWQEHPGRMVTGLLDQLDLNNYEDESDYLRSTNDNIKSLTEGFKSVADNMDTVTTNLLEIQNNMPAFIAANIPKAVWDGISSVNDRLDKDILPFLTKINDSLTDIGNILDQHKKQANALAAKIAAPGDMLTDIKKLSDYARKDQASKIDEMAFYNVNQANQDAITEITPQMNLTKAELDALANTPKAVGFLTLETPGSSPGIEATPYETWLLSIDY